MAEPWIRFVDDHGPGRASPDLILPRLRLVVEVKLTLVLDAEQQLEWLYVPLCEHIWPGAPWRRAVVCQNWVGPLADRMLPGIASLATIPEGALAYLHLPMRM